MGFLEELWNNQSSIVIGSGIVILVLFGIYIQLLNTYKQLFISNSLRFAKKIQERYSFEGVGDLNKKEENLTSSPNWKYVWSSTIEAGDVCDALIIEHQLCYDISSLIGGGLLYFQHPDSLYYLN